MKTITNRIAPIIAFILISMFILAACASEEPRIPVVWTYNPGPSFSTNFKNEDPRRLIKCAVVFEVVDEAAILELEGLNYKVRNAVLSVLGELTMEEITINRNQAEIAARIVEKVNSDIGAAIYGEEFKIVLRAYFTEFSIA